MSIGLMAIGSTACGRMAFGITAYGIVAIGRMVSGKMDFGVMAIGKTVFGKAGDGMKMSSRNEKKVKKTTSFKTKSRLRVANKAGSYSQFSGMIFWRGISAVVTNAYFLLHDNSKFKNHHEIFWRRGNWIDGNCPYCTWFDGVWHNGVWHDGVWKHGEWRFGLWRRGKWFGGLWRGGEWQSDR